LRRFAFTVGGAFVLLAALAYWRHRAIPSAVFIGAGITLTLAGVAAPSRLDPVYRAWMRLAELISRVTTPLIMGLLYFLILTPAGIVRRLASSATRRRRQKAASLWVERPEGRRRGDLTHQF
jgi:hypothetical protein